MIKLERFQHSTLEQTFERLSTLSAKESLNLSDYFYLHFALLHALKLDRKSEGSELVKFVFFRHEYARQSFLVILRQLKIIAFFNPSLFTRNTNGVSLALTFGVLSKLTRDRLFKKFFKQFQPSDFDCLLLGLAPAHSWHPSLLKSCENVERLKIALVEDDKQVPAPSYPRYFHSLLSPRVSLEDYSHTSGPATPKERLKIAICVSGQLRAFEQGLQSWHNLNLADHDVSVFVHTWTETGLTYTSPVHDGRKLPVEIRNAFRIQLEKLGLEGMKNRYKDFFQLWGDLPQYAKSEKIQAVYSADQVMLESDQVEGRSGWSNAEKMYYSVAQANSLMEASRKAFDLVIRVRPDMVFKKALNIDWHRIALQANEEPVLFVDSHGFTNQGTYVFPNLGVCVGDQFAAASPEIMKIYAGTYGFAKESRLETKPHNTLALHLLDSGVRVLGFELGTTLAPIGPNVERQLRALRSDVGKIPKTDWNEMDKQVAILGERSIRE